MEEFIRNAEQTDVSEILLLFEEAYKKPYISQGEIQLGIADGKNSLNPNYLNIKNREIETLIDYPDWFVRVAYNSSQIIGVAISGIESSYDWSNEYGVIADVVVNSKFRGMGGGRKLVEYAENLLRTHSARKIFIEINDKNNDSQKFFSKLGYETISKTAWKQLDHKE